MRWATGGVNQKTPGLGFTPVHACMAGLAAVAKGVDVTPPCTPPLPLGQRGRSGTARLSLFARLAREKRLVDGGASARRGGACRGLKTLGASQAEIADNSDHISVCRVLLGAGANVDALDARCRTPLALAAASGSLEAVEMLLAAGADVGAADIDGNTPAHFALAYANASVAASLAKAGANFDAYNGDGKAPQDVAGFCALIAAGTEEDRPNADA